MQRAKYENEVNLTFTPVINNQVRNDFMPAIIDVLFVFNGTNNMNDQWLRCWSLSIASYEFTAQVGLNIEHSTYKAYFAAIKHMPQPILATDITCKMK